MIPVSRSIILDKCQKSIMKEYELLISKIDTLDLWEDEVTCTRNEYLKVKGSIETKLYYIIEGALRLFIVDEKGEEQSIRFAYKNNFIVCLDSFITGQPSDFYIQTIRQTTLKSLTKNSFFKLIKDEKKLHDVWVSILEQLVLQQLEREKDILTYSPAERYKRVLQRSPQLFQEIPSKYIANYLRMTPETLSRIKKS